MARVTATQQVGRPQDGAQAPAAGVAPVQGGSPGIPQREAAGAPFPGPRAAPAQPARDEGPPARRYKVKFNQGSSGDPALKGGYRIMQPSNGSPGASTYSAVLPAGRIISDASHDIRRLLAQGVELEEILPPPPPPKAEEPEASSEEATA